MSPRDFHESAHELLRSMVLTRRDDEVNHRKVKGVQTATFHYNKHVWVKAEYPVIYDPATFYFTYTIKSPAGRYSVRKSGNSINETYVWIGNVPDDAAAVKLRLYI